MELAQSQVTASTAKQPVKHEPVAFTVDVKVKHETEVDPDQSLQDNALVDNRESNHEPVRSTKLTQAQDMTFTVRVEVKHKTEVSSDMKQAQDGSLRCDGSEHSLKALTSVKTSGIVVSALSSDADISSDRALQQIVDGCFIKLQPLRLLHCDSCKQVFQKRSKLVAHVIDNHFGDSDSTDSDEETKENDLTDDIDTDTSDNLKLYPCNICHEQFTFQSHMKIHKLKHQGKEPLVCDICGKDFADKKALVQHMNIHFKRLTDRIGEPTPCAICNKMFTERSKLKQHIKRHTRPKRFKCKVCQKEFAIKANLKVHHRVHTGKKPFSCNICKKRYTQRGALTVHYRTHTGEKSPCRSKKQFANSSNRVGHKKTPKRIRKLYSCDLCDRKFTKRYYLTEHIHIHITGEKPYYTCDICKNKFCGKTNLSNHMALHTSKEPNAVVQSYNCEFCEKSFNSKSYLSIHKRYHTGERPYTCEICNKGFTRNSYLKRHQTSHTGVKTHICQYCKKTFRQKCDLTIHIRLHTGEKPFKCDICSKAYSHKSNLTTHRLKFHPKKNINIKCT